MNYAPSRTPELQQVNDEERRRWQRWNNLAGDKDILTALAARLELVLQPGFKPNIVLTEDEIFFLGNLTHTIVHSEEFGPALRRILDIDD